MSTAAIFKDSEPGKKNAKGCGNDGLAVFFDDVCTTVRSGSRRNKVFLDCVAGCVQAAIASTRSTRDNTG
eukprot:3928535-Lingulodinium_polyedra.AAC.1